MSLEKLINEKHFTIKEKFSLVSRKLFSFYFRWKILFRSCEKFRNVLLYADYIKFDPQTFNCYIFCFDFFLSISTLRIWFNLIFISILVFIFIIVICFSLIIFNWNFFIYQIWSSFFWLLFTLFEIIFKIVIFFNFILFQLFYLLDLISIIFIVIYFIWDILWN